MASKIEIVSQPQPVDGGWQVTAYNEIRNGAWAVLLTGVIVYGALRGIVARYLDKHIGLLDTMRDSLKRNADSLEDLTKAEQGQNETLAKQGEALEKYGEAILSQQQAILNMDQRQKADVTQAMGMLQATAVNVVRMDETQVEIVTNIKDLKRSAEAHQQELLEKLQAIEDLYHAAEEQTEAQVQVKNLWWKR